MKEKKIDSNFNEFSEIAKGFARNPLGIIALFTVLSYGFASLIVGFSGKSLGENQISPLIWFLVLFPVLVLGVFFWLVSQHSNKLYSPSDFKKEEHFIKFAKNDKENLNDLLLYANEIRSIVYPYRKDNKLNLTKLFEILQNYDANKFRSKKQFNKTLIQLKKTISNRIIFGW